jgi:hypothetical protein
LIDKRLTAADGRSQDDDPDVVLISTSFLLTDAQTHERTYELLNDEGAFPRLVDLIKSPTRHDDEGIHRTLMELLYEMARIQKIKTNDLGLSNLRKCIGQQN